MSQLCIGWTDNIHPEKLTGIWYLSNNISEKLRKVLEHAAKVIGCDLHICLGSLNNEFFKRSWSRLLKKHNISNPDDLDTRNQTTTEEKTDNRKRNKNDRNRDDDDITEYDEDEEDEEDDNNSKEKQRDDDDDADDNDDDDDIDDNDENSENLDQCRNFLSSFLSKKGNHKNKRNNLSNKLSKYPVIKTPKKFLSLQDKSIRNKAFIAKSRRIKSEIDRQKFSELLGGRAMTRSMKKLNDDDKDDSSSLESKQKISPPPKKKRRKLKGDDSSMIEDNPSKSSSSAKVFTQNNTDLKSEKSDEDNDLTFRAEYDKRKMESDGETSAPIHPNSIFLIDDTFSNETSLGRNSKDSMKNLNQEFLKRLSWIKEVFCEKAHLLNIHCVLIEQSLLSNVTGKRASTPEVQRYVHHTA